MKTIPEMLEMVDDDKLKAKLLKLYKDNEQKLKELPASVKYHHAYEGGLMDHFQQIMHCGIRIFKFMEKFAKMDCTLDDVIFLTFVHDWDKLERYVLEGEFKSGDKKGGKKFAHALDVTIDPYAKVVSMLAKEQIYMTDEQIHALAYQSGGWSEFARHGSDMTPLATILHCADMLSSKCTPSRSDLKEESTPKGMLEE